MVISKGEKLHIMYRSIHAGSAKRHFLGEVVFAEGSVCRVEGYVFIYDERKTEYQKKVGARITIFDVAESGYIVNIVDPAVMLDEVYYKYAPGLGLIATDGKKFILNINEFGSKT